MFLLGKFVREPNCSWTGAFVNRGSTVLTPLSRVLLEKLTGIQLVKKFLPFYGTWKFITSFTSARQLSLLWTSSIQSIFPHPASWRSNLILSCHPHFSLPSGLYLTDFQPIQKVYINMYKLEISVLIIYIFSLKVLIFYVFYRHIDITKNTKFCTENWQLIRLSFQI
jgi:hypothetical protein